MGHIGHLYAIQYRQLMIITQQNFIEIHFKFSHWFLFRVAIGKFISQGRLSFKMVP